MTKYNQHSPSRWSMYKRAKAATRRSQKASEDQLLADVIGIAAKYIPTEYLYDFSGEVRACMVEHKQKKPPVL